MKAIIELDVPEYQIGEMVRVYFPDSMVKSGECKPANGWISVKDRLPDRGADVLAFMRNGVETRIVTCNYANNVWFDCVMNCIVAFQSVTHWMPLPEAPKEASLDD